MQFAADSVKFQALTPSGVDVSKCKYCLYAFFVKHVSMVVSYYICKHIDNSLYYVLNIWYVLDMNVFKHNLCFGYNHI